MSVTRNIESTYQAALGKCRDQNCHAQMTGLIDPVSLKGEKLTRDSICDCIIFERGGTVAWLVELKSSSMRATNICSKFENGLTTALDILQNAGFRGNPSLNLILLAKSFGNRSEHKKISAIRIQFSGKKYSIRLCMCGARLAKKGT